MQYFFNIERHQGSALVQIIEIDRTNDDIRPGRIVDEYETTSRGATRSARKSIRKLEQRKCRSTLGP